ncbi:protein YLS7-like [Hibiscus syriacus]|uniref:Protein YLS7-like n=1 Tax=Hibiscus syriacus TaxID=106335 RepID=A0A6A3AEK7_HIBSY|nr:protein YLS7-like [Hibiscus syriacus]
MLVGYFNHDFVLVRVHDLHHHIIPHTEEEEITAYAASKAADPALWKRLDAAVLQWIYGTISTDLLHAILLKDDTAQGAWSRLKSMFHDNKASRATHLEEELPDIDFGNFSSIDSYCNHIKSLVDRLADVDAHLSNNKLVLKLTVGLPEAYNRLAKEGISGNQAALVAGSDSDTSASSRSTSKGNKQKNQTLSLLGRARMEMDKWANNNMGLCHSIGSNSHGPDGHLGWLSGPTLHHAHTLLHLAPQKSTVARIVRCDSTGDLYPLFSINQATLPVNNLAFTTISADIWHNRLGHLGDAVFRPPDVNVIMSMWIFRHKRQSDGSFERYKARLVALSDRLRKPFMALLGTEFAMKDLGPLSFFLWIVVSRNANGMFLSQQQYATDIIQRAGMANCNSSPTPVDTKPKLSASKDSPYEDPTKYRSLSGALQYLTFTRPDLCSSGTLSYGLHLYKSLIHKLIYYTDADWGGCPDTRHSTSGYCVFIGNPVQHQRTKHIEMDIHFVREKVAKGKVRVLHVPSRYQIADIFTKGLPRILFEDFRDSLSVREPPASTEGVC